MAEDTKKKLRKRIKKSGNQLCVTFSKEETECHRLKKDQVLDIEFSVVNPRD